MQHSKPCLSNPCQLGHVTSCWKNRHYNENCYGSLAFCCITLHIYQGEGTKIFSFVLLESELDNFYGIGNNSLVQGGREKSLPVLIPDPAPRISIQM